MRGGARRRGGCACRAAPTDAETRRRRDRRSPRGIRSSPARVRWVRGGGSAPAFLSLARQGEAGPLQPTPTEDVTATTPQKPAPVAATQPCEAAGETQAATCPVPQGGAGREGKAR